MGQAACCGCLLAPIGGVSGRHPAIIRHKILPAMLKRIIISLIHQLVFRGLIAPLNPGVYAPIVHGVFSHDTTCSTSATVMQSGFSERLRRS